MMDGSSFMSDKRLTLSQELKQKLELRPDLKVKQIIKAELLTLPILELSARLTQEVIQNPALEIEEMDVGEVPLTLEQQDEESEETLRELYEDYDVSRINEELYEYIPQHYGGYKDFTEVVETDPIVKSSSSFTDYLMEQYRIRYPEDDIDLVETVIYSLSEKGLFDFYIDELYFYFMRFLIEYIKSELSFYYDIEIGIDDCCYRENTHSVYKGKQILSIEILPEKRKRRKDRIHIPDYRIFIERGDRILNIFVSKEFVNRIRNFVDPEGKRIKKVDHRVIDGIRYSIISVDNLMLFAWWEKWLKTHGNTPQIMSDLEGDIYDKDFRKQMVIRSIVRDIFSVEALERFVSGMPLPYINVVDAEQYVMEDKWVYYIPHTDEEGRRCIRLIFSPLNNAANKFIKENEHRVVEYDESIIYFYIPAGLIFYYKVVDVFVKEDMLIEEIIEKIKENGILLKKSEEYSIKEDRIVIRPFKYNIRFYFNGTQYNFNNLIKANRISMSNVGNNLVACVDKWEFIKSVVDNSRIEKIVREVSRIIENIQSLNPPGVGQFSFKDVILYQMERMKKNPPEDIKSYSEYEKMIDACKHAVELHYEDILKGNISNIPELEEVSSEFIKDLFSHIEPYPSSGEWGKEAALPVVPDVVLKFVEVYKDGKPDIEIVPVFERSNLPNIRLKKDFLIYYKLVKGEEEELKKEYGESFIEAKKRELDRWIKERSKTDMTTKLRKWVENGQNLLVSYYERDRILRGIIKEIINRQRDFILNPKDEKNLKPLSMKEVAEKLGVNESTISRAANSKYVETPYGIYPLSKFFTRYIYKNDGDQVSRNKVKELIKEIIEKEDSANPFSDEEIAEIVSKNYGITIKRRTVAKYREEMGIPSSRKRRKK